MNGKLPDKYKAMFAAVENDPPSGMLAEALEAYRMSVSWLTGPAWTDRNLAQCLAWSLLAGFPECCVLGPMNIPILIASYRFCIRGGCVPDVALFHELILPLANELQIKGKDTPWLPALMERYRVTGWEKLDYVEWVRPDELPKAMQTLMRRFIRDRDEPKPNIRDRD